MTGIESGKRHSKPNLTGEVTPLPSAGLGPTGLHQRKIFRKAQMFSLHPEVGAELVRTVPFVPICTCVFQAHQPRLHTQLQK